MEQTTELRLAWRQEFATAIIDELFVGGDDASDSLAIELMCLGCIRAAEFNPGDMKTLELSLMGYILKRKLKDEGLSAVIRHLKMLEDVFGHEDFKVPLN